MPLWLLHPPAAVGYAAALGIGVFIGLNWEQIKERIQEFQDENSFKWDSSAVDLSLYNPTEDEKDHKDAIRYQEEEQHNSEGAFTSSAQFASSSNTLRDREDHSNMPSNANTTESDHATNQFPQHEMSDSEVEFETETERSSSENVEPFAKLSDGEISPSEDSAVEASNDAASSYDELSDFSSHASSDLEIYPH